MSVFHFMNGPGDLQETEWTISRTPPPSTVPPAAAVEFLPLVIVAPHGGKGEPKGVAERVMRPSSIDSKLSDLHTIELAMAIDAHIKTCTGKKPFFVAAKFHRKCVDANRRADDNAFNLEAEQVGRRVYDEYHSLVEECIEGALRCRSPHGVLLLDIHGCKHNESQMTLILGTQNGQSYDRRRHRIPNVGFEWHLRSLFLIPDMLAVLPGTEEPDIKKYAGGHTVISHHRPDSVSAIQIEFNQRVRHCRMSRMRSATMVAEAYVRHLQSPLLAAIPTCQQLSTKKNVVFLDIDGVLCNWRSYNEGGSSLDADMVHDPKMQSPPLELRCLLNLKYLLEKSRAKVVLSSTWRLDDQLVGFLGYAFRSVDIDESVIIGKTPDLDSGRGYEIRAWLEEHREACRGFVILDDCNEVNIIEAIPQPNTNLVQTFLRPQCSCKISCDCFDETRAEGLTEAKVEEALALISKDVIVSKILEAS